MAGSEVSVRLYADYVFLDTDERKRFAQTSHEYLIEQLQYTGTESVTLQPGSTIEDHFRLNFNHPCKELIFFIQRDSELLKNRWFNFGENSSHWETPHVKGVDHLVSAHLLLNGHERFEKRPGSYFRLVMPFQSHTRVPTRNLYVYSFSLRREEHQPSGSCNFSRIDNASLHVTLDKACTKEPESARVSIFAINYNVLKVMSGMAGAAFSN